LVKKFAYQRFEPSGFTKNPDIRHATSITDYVFRWLACQFIKGYKEATAPNRAQPDLPLKEIPDIEKKALNRPVTDLARTGDKEVIDVITGHPSSHGNDGTGNGNGAGTIRQVTVALGSIFGHHLFRVRQRQSHSRRRGVRTECGTAKTQLRTNLSASCKIEFGVVTVGLQSVDACDWTRERSRLEFVARFSIE
jgi:hypothetical protein